MMTVNDFKERIDELKDQLACDDRHESQKAFYMLLGIRTACFFMEDTVSGELYKLVKNILAKHVEKNI